MKPRIAVAVAFALLLEERATTSQEDYLHSSYYKASEPICAETTRLKGLCQSVLVSKKIPADRSTWALFCRVAQAYRLQAHELKSHFFLEA